MRSQAESSSPSNAIVRYGPLALILAGGVALRLRPFLFNRSLWLDEAMLAVNVAERGFLQLAAPLDYAQSAPLGFLWLSRAFTVILGNRDQVLRLVPFLSGLLAMGLLAWFAMRVAPRGAGLLALLLYAIGARSIYYASEFKQYSTETAVALLLLVAATPLLLGEWKRRRLVIWTIIAALAIWFAHPAVFVFAGIWTALLVTRGQAKDRQGARDLALALLVVVVSFAANYFLLLRAVGERQGLYRFWSAFFMPPAPQTALPWLWSTFQAALVNPVGLTLPLLGLALFVVGAGRLLRERLALGLALLLPLVYALAASALHQYPFGDRMLLFAVPGVLLVIGHGVAALALAARRVRFGPQVVWIVCAVALTLGPAVEAARAFGQPFEGEQIRPAVARLAAERRPGDLLYVYYSAYPGWRYYAPQFGLDERKDVIKGLSARTAPEKYAEALAQLPATGRVWMLFSHVYTGDAGNEEGLITALAGERGKVVRMESFPGATLYLLTLVREK